MSVDILAVGAHPDDVEFGCGALLAKMAAEGKRIGIVDLTLGDKGTHGTPDVRRQEAQNAADLIGAERIFLDFPDCEVMDDYDSRLKLVRVIREMKPRLVLAPLWEGQMNHPDHLACGKLVRYACRYARFASILPDIPIHRPEGVLHYFGPAHTGPIDFLVDVTAHVETWKKMIAAHASQMQTLPYLDWNVRNAARLGVLIGKDYAQGFVKGNPVQVDDILTVARGTIEI